jgi:hypothetical protein
VGSSEVVSGGRRASEGCTPASFERYCVLIVRTAPSHCFDMPRFSSRVSDWRLAFRAFQLGSVAPGSASSTQMAADMRGRPDDATCQMADDYTSQVPRKRSRGPRTIICLMSAAQAVATPHLIHSEEWNVREALSVGCTQRPCRPIRPKRKFARTHPDPRRTPWHT